MTSSKARSTLNSNFAAFRRVDRADMRVPKSKAQRCRCIFGSRAYPSFPTFCAMVRKPWAMSLAMKSASNDDDQQNSPL